jgi:plastocyanin
MRKKFKKVLSTLLTACLMILIVTSPAKAFPIADYAWSDEQWIEVSKDVRTSYNPNASLNPDKLTIKVDDERFVDFIYWVWHNKINEHQVEMIGGSEWDGHTDGVIFHWAPGSRWETHTVMPFDMAIGHVTGEHQWFDTQFPDFFEPHGGVKRVNIKERLLVDKSPTWGEFVNFIGDPNGLYYRYLYHQEVAIDPEKKLVYMMGGNGVVFTYTFQRYLDELKEVLTDVKSYQFFEMYDELGKGFAEKLGWAQNPIPKGAEVAYTGNATTNQHDVHMEGDSSTNTLIAAQPTDGTYNGLKKIEVSVNGKELVFDSPSVLLGSKTYTPVRDLVGALHYQFAWDKETQTVYVAKEISSKVDIDAPSGTYRHPTVNLVVEGQRIDQPSVVIDNLIYVPLKEFSEALDISLKWNGLQQKSTNINPDYTTDNKGSFAHTVQQLKEQWTGGTIPLDEYTGEIKEFDLEIHTIQQEIAPGVTEEMWGFGLAGQPSSVPGPVLRVEKGDLVRINFNNTHDQPHSIHTHGMNSVSTKMDGVPHLSHMVMPGQSFTYQFVANEAGTFGYHCHVQTNVHLQMGMFGALIVEDPEEQELIDRDYTLVLSEWETGRNPNDAEHVPEYDHFLINGKGYPLISPIEIKQDEIARIRIINFGAQVHSLHLHGSTFTVIHKDGHQLPVPYRADTLLLGAGERYDVLLKGRDGKFIWHDHNTNAETMHIDVIGSQTE